MKVLVIGAAGKTGRAVVDRAVAAGHEVTASVHTPGDQSVPGVRVVVGDAADSTAMDGAVAGQHAVIDTLGGKPRTRRRRWRRTRPARSSGP